MSILMRFFSLLTVVAMLVLVGEVFYYKRKTKKANALAIQVHPFESSDYSKQFEKNSILLGNGGEFVPIYKRKPRLSFIDVQAQE